MRAANRAVQFPNKADYNLQSNFNELKRPVVPPARGHAINLRGRKMINKLGKRKENSTTQNYIFFSDFVWLF